MKKLIKIALFILVLLVALGIILPYFFKDDIIAEVKKQINKQTGATIDFDDVSLGIIRSFPSFSIGLHDLTISTPGDLPHQDFAEITDILLKANFWSVVNQNTPIEINEIFINNPNLGIRTNAQGIGNYEYLVPKESIAASGETSNMTLKLEQFSINNGHIKYLDQSTNTSLTITDLDHEGSGLIYSDIYDLETKTTIASLDLNNTGIRYLKNAKVDATLDIKVDQNNQLYEFTKAMLSLNDLEIDLEGKLQNIDQAQNIDLKFASKNNRFKDFLSLIPGAYTQNFDQVKTDGDLTFNGNVKGMHFAGQNIYPKFNVIIKSENAYFQYPDLPEKVENINIDLQVLNQTNNIENTSVDISSFHFDIGQNPFTGNLRLDQIMGNTTFDGEFKGRFDLGVIQNAYPLEEIENLSGNTDFDFKIKGNKNAVLNNQSSQIQLSGFANANKIKVQARDQPTIVIEKIVNTLDANTLDFMLSKGKFGNSDITFGGQLSNPIGLVLEEMPIKGTLNLDAKVIDVNEWYQANDEVDTIDTTISPSRFDATDLGINANIQVLKYEDYNFTNIATQGMINGDILSLNQATLTNKSTTINTSGTLENIWAYVLSNEDLIGELKLKSESFNLNDFMTTVEAPSDDMAAAEVILIPKNLDIEIDATAKEVIYEKVTLKDASTTVYLSNAEAGLQGFTSNGLGGVIKMDGTYNTQDETQPKFSFKYDMSKLRIDELTSSIETVPILAPILKFIDGVCNSTLMLSGDLTPDLFPNFNTLTGQGYLETSESKIKGYRPIQKVNELLSFDDAKNWTIRNTKNWFEIKDGAMEVKEFDYTWEGIDFKIGGTHKLNQDMNYLLKAKVPRELLQKIKIGALANEGINSLINSINKAGIPLDNSEFIDVNIYLSGHIKSPKIKVEPVGVSGPSVKEAAKQVIAEKTQEIKDSVSTRIEEEKDKAITKAEEKVDEIKDSITTKVEEEVVAATNKAKDMIQEEIKEKTDSLIGGVLKDTLASQIEDKLGGLFGDKAKTERDSIKSKLDKWNPFKKKKKKNEN